MGFTQGVLDVAHRRLPVALESGRHRDGPPDATVLRQPTGPQARGHPGAMPKADALRDAKAWLRDLRRSDFLALTADLSGGVERGKGAEARRPAELSRSSPRWR